MFTKRNIALFVLLAFAAWGGYRHFFGNEQNDNANVAEGQQQATVKEAEQIVGKDQRKARAGRGRQKAAVESRETEESTAEYYGTDDSFTRAIKALREYLESDDFKSLPLSRQMVKHMRLALDGGDKHLALKYARELMDDGDPEIRHAALDTFGWIGMSALSEITEMMADPDKGIAEEALSKWSTIFEEIPEEVDRAAILIELVPTLNSQVEVDTALMALTKMSAKTGIETTVKIIEGSTSLGSECARDMYEHLTGGEVYENEATAAKIVERILRLQNGENYQKVMMETGGEAYLSPREPTGAESATKQQAAPTTSMQ